MSEFSKNDIVEFLLKYKIEIVEYLIIGFVILLQFRFYKNTLININLFKYAIPNKLKIIKIYLKDNDIAKLKISDIEVLELKNFENKTENTEDQFEEDELHEVNIIRLINSGRYNASILVNLINYYLIKRRGTISDFSEINDVIERNINSKEEEVNQTISIPIYLGLMGTMLGIVIGLFAMPDLGADNSLIEQGIKNILGGVKIAMIGSFTGLLFTILNSGWHFKKAKIYLSKSKSEFLAFLQTELMRVNSQSMGTIFDKLQNNLSKFNSEFSKNLTKVSTVFKDNLATLSVQEKIINDISKLDIVNISKHNINVLKQLQINVEEFEKFNKLSSNLNLFVSNSTSLTDRFNEVLERTLNFKTIAENLENNISQSRELIEFLTSHFQTLGEHKVHVSESIAKTSHSISDIFNELKTHIQSSSNELKKFTVDEVDLFKKALSDSRTNLGNLQFLESINSEISQLKTNTKIQSDKLNEQIDILNSNLLKSIEKKTKKPINNLIDKTILGRIKKLFKYREN